MPSSAVMVRNQLAARATSPSRASADSTIVYEQQSGGGPSSPRRKRERSAAACAGRLARTSDSSSWLSRIVSGAMPRAVIRRSTAAASSGCAVFAYAAIVVEYETKLGGTPAASILSSHSSASSGSRARAQHANTLLKHCASGCSPSCFIAPNHSAARAGAVDAPGESEIIEEKVTVSGATPAACIECSSASASAARSHRSKQPITRLYASVEPPPPPPPPPPPAASMRRSSASASSASPARAQTESSAWKVGTCGRGSKQAARSTSLHGSAPCLCWLCGAFGAASPHPHESLSLESQLHPCSLSDASHVGCHPVRLHLVQHAARRLVLAAHRVPLCDRRVRHHRRREARVARRLQRPRRLRHPPRHRKRLNQSRVGADVGGDVRSQAHLRHQRGGALGLACAREAGDGARVRARVWLDAPAAHAMDPRGGAVRLAGVGVRSDEGVEGAEVGAVLALADHHAQRLHHLVRQPRRAVRRHRAVVLRAARRRL
mmetsp:Transcript_5021/g.16327  ORF Transcript_5021/g.16327 Transcript_5021/m.16327 type:complete len:491 (-) Transcript_5021:513-1985(-)